MKTVKSKKKSYIWVTIKCPYCGAKHRVKYGLDITGFQAYICASISSDAPTCRKAFIYKIELRPKVITSRIPH